MLLPKRVIHRARLRERVNGKKPDLKILIGSLSTHDRYFLDEENAIVLMSNYDSSRKENYIMIHYRMIDGKLIEINHWYQHTYYFGPHDEDVIKDLNLFMVQGGHGIRDTSCKFSHAIYNYKLGKFIVPKGIFDCIGTTNRVAGMDYQVDGPNYLGEYDSFLAYFALSSTYEEDDMITYKNPVTQEKMISCFHQQELYFALLNTDGSIRDNKLFQGKDFSRIENIIDLDKYSSLEDFKQQRIQILNQKKQQEKLEYYHKLKMSNQESISPYLDDEVLHVLKLRKNNRDKRENYKSDDY